MKCMINMVDAHVHDANRILSASLNDKILQDKGIEATRSPRNNSTMIMLIQFTIQ